MANYQNITPIKPTLGKIITTMKGHSQKFYFRKTLLPKNRE